MSVDNIHGAHRFLRTIVRNNDLRNLKLIHPEHITRIDRIFSPKYQINMTLHPTVHGTRRDVIIEAARSAAKAVKKTSTQSKKKKVKTNRITLKSLSERVTLLEKQKAALSTDLKQLEKKKVIPLEKIVGTIGKQISTVEDLSKVMQTNFTKAEKLATKDGKALKKLHEEIKAEIRPKVNLHQKDIKEIRNRLERLEAMHKTYSKIGNTDSVRLKELGERITLTKQTLSKLELE